MIRITRGTTNVFVDLGFPDAAELQTKTRLALAVNDLLGARKLKQREIATVLGVTQPEASALKSYHLAQSSVGRLMEFLTALNQEAPFEGDKCTVRTPRGKRRRIFSCRMHRDPSFTRILAEVRVLTMARR
jgi:predicted XRE-type DNA-binding protein